MNRYIIMLLAGFLLATTLGSCTYMSQPKCNGRKVANHR